MSEKMTEKMGELAIDTPAPAPAHAHAPAPAPAQQEAAKPQPAPAKPSNRFVFKISHGGELRRLTVTPATTYGQLFSLLEDSCGPFPEGAMARLVWTDEDNDDISLRSDADLKEAVAFLRASGASALRLRLEVTLGEELPDYAQAAGAGDSDDPELDSQEHQELEKELAEIEQEAGGLELPSLVHPRLRKRLEKINRKFASRRAKWEANLARLRAKPFFDEDEFERQVKVLEGEGVPARPFVRILLAKRLVQGRKRVHRQVSRQNPTLVGAELERAVSAAATSAIQASPFPPPCHKRTPNMSPATVERLGRFHQAGLPYGRLMGLYLNSRGGEAAGLSGEQGELVSRQLEELVDLDEIPRQYLVRVLERANRRKKFAC